ncbi:MAG TPA: hypothetical protein VFN71_03155 [Methylomirabilota bacterium]|nr:hypothetical protein [Methylomirabilota bacterium]
MTRPSRISRARIVGQLRLAAKKGDRAALMLAADAMKTWAYSPRHWEKYLDLLGHPLARLVDMTLIKQGDKIAHQKGWIRPKRARAKPAAKAKPKRGRSRRAARPAGTAQPSLFPDFSA